MANYDKRQLLKTAYNYAQSGQWDRALREYQTISRLFPSDANIHLMIADIFARLKKAGEAVREYLEAARIQQEARQDEKELVTLRKILRLSAGHSVAMEAVEKNVTRRLTRARSLFGQERFEDAEGICDDLLGHDPGNLGVNRLLDDIKMERAKRASDVARVQEEEKAKEKVRAAKLDVGEQATREVLSRLEMTADQYLAAGDFDNAIETMLIMLKIDPGMSEVRELLEETQRLLEKRRAAQEVWSDVQSAPANAVKEIQKSKEDLLSRDEWIRQENELKSRMESERAAAEKIQKQEQDIIERAVAEMEAQKREDVENLEEEKEEKKEGENSLKALPPLPPPPEPRSEKKPAFEKPIQNALDAQDLMALAQKRADARSAVDARNLANRLEKDAETQAENFSPQEPPAKAAADPSPVKEEQRQTDSEMLQHAIEMARQEAEAKAHAEDLEEFEKKIEQQKRASDDRLALERASFARQEKLLKQQIQDLMEKEVAKLTADIRTKTVADIKQQLEKEQTAAREKEAQEKLKQGVLESELRAKKELEERLRREAERKILGEKRAIEHLKTYHDTRKVDFAAQAKELRQARQSGGEDKKKVVRSSRHISDAIRAAATQYIKTDTEAMIETVRNYMKQNLLLDAMKMCQQISEKDPDNPVVKDLLKEIYVKKGL